MAEIKWTVLLFLVILLLAVVSSQIICNIDMTTNGKPCTIPFIYNGATYSSCTKAGGSSQYWCATGANYARDRQRGICDCGQASGAATTSTTKAPITDSGSCIPMAYGKKPCAPQYQYDGIIYSGCINIKNEGVYWCALTDNYDRDASWGNCETTCIYAGVRSTAQTGAAPATPTTQSSSGLCMENTKIGQNCADTFLYKGQVYTGCINNDYKTYWCSLTYTYGINTWKECATPLKCKNTGCRERTVQAQDCAMHFMYKGKKYNGCIRTDSSRNQLWCALTYTFKEGQWQDCALPLKCGDQTDATPKPTPVPTPGPSWDRRDDQGCIVYIENSADQCHFPFTYKNLTYTSCTRFEQERPWCAKTNVYIAGLSGFCGVKDCTDNPNPTPRPATVNCAGGKISVNAIDVITATRTQRVPVRMEGCFGDVQPTGVFFDEAQYPCSQKIGSWTKGVIECTTPGNIPIVKVKNLMQIILRIGTQDVATGQYFNFRLNAQEPYIDSVSDMTTVAGGQVKVRMRGGNLQGDLNSGVPKFRMSAQIKNKRDLYYEQDCTPLSASNMDCRTPVINTLQVDQRRKREIPSLQVDPNSKLVSIPSRVDFIPGVLIGNSKKYLDFSLLFPGVSPVTVYKTPTIYTQQSTVTYQTFWPSNDKDIIIDGKYLSTMFDRNDYKVIIGGNINICEITVFNDNRIICRPKGPPKEADGSKVKNPNVNVMITPLSLTFRAMTLSYQATFVDFQEGFAGVIAGGGALILIVLIVAIVCCMRRSRRNQMDDDDYEKHLDSVPSTPRGSTGMNGFKYNSHAPMYTSPRKPRNNHNSQHNSQQSSRRSSHHSHHGSQHSMHSSRRPREPTPKSSRASSRTGSIKSYTSEPDWAY